MCTLKGKNGVPRRLDVYVTAESGVQPACWLQLSHSHFLHSIGVSETNIGHY